MTTQIARPCDTYFVRHSGKLSLGKEEIERLCNENRIFIHYPGAGTVDKKSTDPNDYPNRSAKSAITTLNKLARQGGFVWSEYRGLSIAKVGYVSPSSPIELVESTWKTDHPGRKAILKSLRYSDEYTTTVGAHELMHLRARRPRQGTIVRWHKAGTFVERYVLGKTANQTWDGLSVDQQECVCLEFLRDRHADLPRLSRLLMPPGRTLKDIDIYAVADDGNEIFAQVTNHGRATSASRTKIEKLKKYEGVANHLIYFCLCDRVQHDDGVTFVPVTDVHAWLMRQTLYAKTLYG